MMQMTAHRPALRRIALTTAAALAAGSLAAIGAAAAAAATGPVTAADKALFAYAKCMRDKGVSIPDPAQGADGRFTFPAIPKSVTSAAGVQAKANACATTSGARGGRGGFGGTRTPAQQAAFKKFQDCLKANGVTLPGPGQRRPPAAGTPAGAKPGAKPSATTTTKSGQATKPAGAGSGAGAAASGAGPGGGFRGGGFRGGVRDAKTQAAYQKCQALLPARPATGG